MVYQLCILYVLYSNITLCHHSLLFQCSDADIFSMHPNVCFHQLNVILFGATLWALRPTLANMKSDVSSTDTR